MAFCTERGFISSCSTSSENSLGLMHSGLQQVMVEQGCFEKVSGYDRWAHAMALWTERTAISSRNSSSDRALGLVLLKETVRSCHGVTVKALSKKLPSGCTVSSETRAATASTLRRRWICSSKFLVAVLR